MAKATRYHPGYALPGIKPGLCTVKTTVTRRLWRLWKPYTLSIWIRGRWVARQAFWRRTDCERVRFTLKSVVNDWNRAHGYIGLESRAPFPEKAYPSNLETV